MKKEKHEYIGADSGARILSLEELAGVYGGARTVRSQKSVNIGADMNLVAGTEWHSLELRIMCPDQETMKQMFSAVASLMSGMGFDAVAEQLMGHRDDPQDECTMSQAWPDKFGKLIVRGSASRVG